MAKVQEGHTRIATGKLVEILKANRERHASEFKDALAGWRKSYAAALRKVADTCRDAAAKLDGDAMRGVAPEIVQLERDLFFDLPVKPADHTADYDRIIRRLELSEDQEQFVKHSDFDRYVLDEWSWKGAHNEALNAYSEVVR